MSDSHSCGSRDPRLSSIALSDWMKEIVNAQLLVHQPFCTLTLVVTHLPLSARTIFQLPQKDDSAKFTVGKVVS